MALWQLELGVLERDLVGLLKDHLPVLIITLSDSRPLRALKILCHITLGAPLYTYHRLNCGKDHKKKPWIAS